MPEPSRLSPQEYTALCQHLSALCQHLSALAASLHVLEHVSRWLAPGMQVSVETAYQEMWHKTDAALRAHVLHASRALALWEAQRLEHTMQHAGARTPPAGGPHAHP